MEAPTSAPADVEPKDPFLAALGERTRALLEEALRESRSRPALRTRIQCRLAWATRFKKGFAGALEHARAALELAEELDDDPLRVEALAILTFLGCAVGDPEAPAHAARAHELAAASGDPVRAESSTSAGMSAVRFGAALA